MEAPTRAAMPVPMQTPSRRTDSIAILNYFVLGLSKEFDREVLRWQIEGERIRKGVAQMKEEEKLLM